MSALDAGDPGTDGTVDDAPTAGSRGTRSLLRLYLVRGLVALAWSAGFAWVADPLTAITSVLLVAYPVIDMVASLVDPARCPGSGRGLLQFNAAAGALAALALAVASAVGPGAVLHVFGIWAVISGAAQVVVALHGRGLRAGGQWPMLLAGGLSVLAGITYVAMAMGDEPRLGALAVYAGGGGAFFVVQAGLLARRRRGASR